MSIPEERAVRLSSERVSLLDANGNLCLGNSSIPRTLKEGIGKNLFELNTTVIYKTDPEKVIRLYGIENTFSLEDVKDKNFTVTTRARYNVTVIVTENTNCTQVERQVNGTMIELFEDNPDAEISSTLGVGAIITLSIVSVFCGSIFLCFIIFLSCIVVTNCATRFFAGLMHQSIPTAPSPPPPPPAPRATAGRLPALSVPGVEHLQILRCPGTGHLPTPGPAPRIWQAHGFLSKYNYTEDFTGKKSRLAHLSRTGKIEEVCKGMFSFYACISSLLIKPELHSEIGSCRRESTFFWLLNQNSVVIIHWLFEEHPFISILQNYS